MNNSQRLQVVLATYVMDGTSEDYQDENLSLKDTCRMILRVYDEQGMNHAYNVKRHNNYQERVADWMMGLPSPWHPDFENYRIEELLREWEIIKEDDNEKKVEARISNWFMWWANFLIVQSNYNKD